MKTGLLLPLVLLLQLATPGNCEQEFPILRAAPIVLGGAWEQAEAVVVADLRNIRQLGVQKGVRLSWPEIGRPVPIYWCQGDLEVQVTIRRKPLPPGKKYVWGAGLPGCALPRKEEPTPVFRVWYVRQESDYIRPVVDYPRGFFQNFYVAWPDTPGTTEVFRYGHLILTPIANGLSEGEFAQAFFNPASLACDVLGQDECIRQIRALALSSGPDLRKAACEFLTSEFRVDCGS